MNLPTLGAAMTALSVATDFAMAQTAHFGLRSSVLAVQLARAMGWSETQARQAHYQALLRYIGCNVETQLMAALVGDELAVRREFAGIDTADRAAVAKLLLRRLRLAHQGEPALRAVFNIARVMLSAEHEMARMFAGHCEVGQRLAGRIGLEHEVVNSLGQLYERWDGKGLPKRLRGEAVAPSALLVSLAQDVVVHHDSGGADAAIAMVKARRGTAHAPGMSDAFVRHAPALFERLAAVDTGAVPDVPGGDETLDDERFDAVCAALADFVDIKSPYTLAHSAGVAHLAAGAAQRLRLGEADVRLARRAGWVHDLGKVGVSAAVWCKPGPLNRPEQEQVRLHAYYTERILAAAPALAPLAELASLTHDRLDGSGYFRRPPPSAMPRVARVLAAADMYQALTEERPHRAAFAAAGAARLLRAEAQAGRLDAAACEAVLEASGQHRPGPPRTAALTEREVEVLCSLAQGRSMKQIGRELAISPKTVDHHLQHIYAKVGVSTRAGATLYAMEQGYTATVH